MNEIPNNLVREVSQRHCVLFLGPDAGETAGGYRGLPTSWQLADDLAKLVNPQQRYLPLPQSAQVYAHTFNREKLVDYLRQRLDDPTHHPLPIHELIARIPFAFIVHAGWDRLLERALDKQGVPYRLVQSVHDLPYEPPNQGQLLYKPYGSLDRPDTLVITENDQLNVLNQLKGLHRRLAELVASYTLLMVGYAPDYDSVFVRIYHEIRQEQEQHRRPAFVVTSLSRPEDAIQWAARGIEPLVANPIFFLRDLAQTIANVEGLSIDLPDLTIISQAPTVTQDDLPEPTQVFNRVLATVGIGELIEQTDVPLLSAAQVRDLEAMRLAYERLTENLEPVTDSAQVWLRLGNVEYSRQNYDSASRYYHLALAAQPKLAEAHHNLHFLHLTQGNLEKALEAYQRTIELRPDMAILPARYQINGVLGRGGMGIVYRALDMQTGQTVALKLLDRAYLRTERVIARFEREAKFLKHLDHPHIVRYLDFQQYQGRFYIVMEYLVGQTLADRLRQTNRMSLDEAYLLFQQMCQAVSFAHEKQIIHRDIKPANIFILDRLIKLIDFGLATDLAAGQPSVVGLATGTVAYMAPEQVAGQQVDERTDVYALGTVFYEMVTGCHPAQGAYHPPSEIVAGLTESFDMVFQKAREYTPSKRYISVKSFYQEVARIMPLQPASQQAAIWRRFLARLEMGIRTYRFFLLAATVIGFLVSVTKLPGPGYALIRVGGLLLWDAFLLSFANLFLGWKARQSGYASLLAYSSLSGVVLGVCIGVLSYLATDPQSFDFSHMDWINYVINLIMPHSLATVVVGFFSFLFALGGISLTIRLRINPRLGVIAGFSLMIVLYALFLFGSELFL